MRVFYKVVTHFSSILKSFLRTILVKRFFI